MTGFVGRCPCYSSVEYHPRKRGRGLRASDGRVLPVRERGGRALTACSTTSSSI